MGDKTYGYFKGGAASLKDQTKSAFGLDEDKTEVQEELVAPITVDDLDSRPLSLLDAKGDDKYLGEFDGQHMFLDRLGKTYTISGTAKPEDNRTGAERWKENLEPVVSAAKLWWEEGADLPSVQQIYGVGKAVAEGVYDTVSKISGAATGKVSGNDITLADVFDATAGMGVGSSLVKVPEGSLRIFGGLNAKNAPAGDEITDAFNSEFEVFKNKVKSEEIDLEYEDIYDVLNSDPSNKDAISYIQMRDAIGSYSVPDAQPKALALMAKYPDLFKKTLKVLEKNKDNYSVGKDGLIRFEIDDSKSKIKNTRFTELADDHDYLTSMDELEYAKKEYSKDFGDYVEKDWTTLEDVLDHPDLFDQYPDLKEIAIVTNKTYFEDPDNEGVLGVFYPEEGIININPELSDDQLKSTLLHEVQHAVQKEENFQGGANSESAQVRMILKARSGSKEAIDVWERYNKKWEAYEKELEIYDNLNPVKKLITAGPRMPVMPRAYIEGEGTIDLIDGYFDPNKFPPEINSRLQIVYSMASGEVEARNVQKRIDMTPFQRKHYKPEVTEDMPFSFQWTDKDVEKAIQDGYDRELSYSKSSNISKQKYRYNPDIEPEVYDAFEELADIQRGTPEITMTQAQNVLGGGVLSYALEHAGDLTHRMAEKGGVWGGAYVSPKVERLIKSLNSEYGFEKEHLGNLKSNSKFELEQNKSNKPFDEYYKDFVSRVEKITNKYSQEHKKVPVYNDMQLAGRETAIAIGEGRYKDALENLYKIKTALDNGTYETKALEFNTKIDFRNKENNNE